MVSLCHTELLKPEAIVVLVLHYCKVGRVEQFVELIGNPFLRIRTIFPSERGPALGMEEGRVETIGGRNGPSGKEDNV